MARNSQWSVTFDVITTESLEGGGVDRSGYIAQCVTLREAVSHFRGETDDGGPSLSDDGSFPEPNSLPFDKDGPGWITQTFSLDDPDEGISEARSLHFPDNITPASRRRLCRLLDVYGAPPVPAPESLLDIARTLATVAAEEADEHERAGDEIADRVAVDWREREARAKAAIFIAESPYKGLTPTEADLIDAVEQLVKALSAAVDLSDHRDAADAREAVDNAFDAVQACGFEPAFAEAQWFVNYYVCSNCGERWQDEWSAMCDDDCPACGVSNSPVRSESKREPRGGL